ncbi:tyrosine-protein phosphatase non-receptor type 1-like [Saccostrea cucullata]|uniref:tyrosine-protein phosphatase non-receptor type 1-like n=1 Tax=Saccostrea cuccullata TaxID=36930 RepID=UPI002ED1F722
MLVIYYSIKHLNLLQEAMTIRILLYKCNFWPDCKTIPNSVLKFLKLTNAVELHNYSNYTGPIVVQCINGAEKSGLFCVLQVVLERLKIEQDVAIHQVIQQMHIVRLSIIPNVVQLHLRCSYGVLEPI